MHAGKDNGDAHALTGLSNGTTTDTSTTGQCTGTYDCKGTESAVFAGMVTSSAGKVMVRFGYRIKDEFHTYRERSKYELLGEWVDATAWY